jgi:DNA-binding MarR family transcriptional regulator
MSTSTAGTRGAGHRGKRRPTDPDGPGQIGHEVSRFIRGFKSLQAQTAHRLRHGVDPSAYPVLFQLVDAPKRTTELATCLHADTSTISRQVTSLVEVGLVERTQDPEDRRATILVATDAGRSVFAAMQRDRDRLMTQIVAGWSAPDVAAFVRLLSRFNDDFDVARTAIIAELNKEH